MFLHICIFYSKRFILQGEFLDMATWSRQVWLFKVLFF